MAAKFQKIYSVFLAFTSFIFLSLESQALTVSVSGATNYVQDSTTATNVTVYAGFAYPEHCDARDNVSTCNSCSGRTVTLNSSTVPAPCNEASIYDTLSVTITVNSDKTDINGLAVAASKTSDYDQRITEITETTANGSSYSITTTWGELITAIAGTDSSTTFSISSCTTKCGGSRTFYIGPVKDSEFVEKIAVTVVLSYAGTSNTETKALASLCPPIDDTLTSPVVGGSSGFCYYKMLPGDEKAYITDNIPGWGTSPKDPDSGVAYSQLVMYYAEKGATQTAADVLKSIQNNSSKAVMNITSSATDPLEDYKISGLSNEGITYCFLSAIKDIAGNIQYFNDIQRVKTGVDYSFYTGDWESLYSTEFCATPAEVMGVLGDKSCFIATATFGSSLHPYLDILRNFRDKKLLAHQWGQKFVKWYYQNGPIGAKWIEQHNYVKPIVRVLLLPLIGMAYLSVQQEELFWTLIFAFLFLAVIFGLKKLKAKVLDTRISNLQTCQRNEKQIVYLLAFIFFCSAFHPNFVRAQTSTNVEDEFMEEPVSSPMPSNQDLPPNEPPFVKSQDQMEAEKLNDLPPIEEVQTPQQSQQPQQSPAPESLPSHKRIAHPNAAKGLYLIDQTTGKYYYRTEKKSQKNQTTSVRLGLIDPPGIEATPDVGNAFTFADMYGEDQLPFLMLDYEWQPFTRFGKLGFILGMGFFTATGNGRFKVDNGIPEAQESYTFIGLPISAGILYRFEFSHRQWLVPFVNGGASYYLLAEIRDDGKRPAFLGTPAAYGSGGVMFNITAWDKEIAFSMDREYGISNMWLTAEFKGIQSLNEDIDLSTSFFNIGISVDY